MVQHSRSSVEGISEDPGGVTGPVDAVEGVAGGAIGGQAPGVSEVKGSDPWGLRRAEVLLCNLKGVLSARIVADDRGEVTEIHVLTEHGPTPKQVVRNVESALLAQLGFRVDHRRISVAQTAEVVEFDTPQEVVAGADSEPLPGGKGDMNQTRGVVFRKVEVSPAEAHQRVTVRVVLERDGEEMIAEETAGDAPSTRLAAAARAAVSIVNGLVSDLTLDLAGVRIVDAFDASFVFVGVHVLDSRESKLYSGTCQIRAGSEQAAVLAALDAINRWLGQAL